nr:tryptophan synthase subunit alpha [Kineosphaera limosa]
MEDVLAATRGADRAALIAYLPVGFPTVEQSLEAMAAVVEAGADVVEIGFPYSDPVMDGPVIQAAAQRALTEGVRITDIFAAVRTVTQAGGAAVVMSYWNPILRYGVDRFAADLAAAGGSGVITPDLIPDEAGEWLAAADKHDLCPIFLVAPSSTTDRIAMTTGACRGFVYTTALMGVTGERTSVGDEAATLVARVRAATTESDLPVCVGLGVSTRAQAAQVAAFADGVIVGSALVRELDPSRPFPEALASLRTAAQELRAGVGQGRGAASRS